VTGCLTAPRRIAEARHLVTRHLDERGVDDAITDSAVLLVSELVTNAIVHGEPPIELRVQVPTDVVRVEVYDSDPEALLALPGLSTSPPAATSASALPPMERLGGRGLRLVDALASRWGLDEDESGKCVWFEIDLR